MRWLVATGLALLPVASAAHAEPSTPQLSPLHHQREDAERLRDQLRGLDHDRPPAPAVATPPSTPPSPPPGAPPAPHAGHPTLRGVGVALVVIAGVSGLTTLTLYATTPSDPTISGSYDSWKALFTATTVITGVAGFALVIANRTVQVTPAVTPQSVGLAIAGQL
jgi:hypothetical protein